MAIVMNLPVILWACWAFIAGAAVGSMLNVCVARLPLEKSILWPGSRCGSCLQSIRWFDNVPLLSYWLLRGRCRNCGATFSVRYFLLELVTGLAFAGLFLVEIVWNVHDITFFKQQQWNLRNGIVVWECWCYWLHHCLLVSFLIACAGCDLDRREIPLSLTFTGLIFGLIGSALFPWPWPMSIAEPGVLPQPNPPNLPWWLLDPKDALRPALYPWPVWGPLPDWMPLGSHLSGLAAGLAGALVGTFMLRGVRVTFGKGFGQEALGLGDADLMMMAGSFLGWQPVIVAFFAGGLVALVFGIGQLILTGKTDLPFGPGLAVGCVVTMLGWRWIAPAVQPLMFNAMILALAVGASAAFMLIFGALFGRLRRTRAESA
jgi:leader peptidase (prepilin peptidase)/N-methyltransferase